MLSNCSQFMRYLVHISVLFLCFSLVASGQDTRIIWQKTIGGVGYDKINDIVSDPAGDSFILSTVQDDNHHEIQVSKISAGGVFEWTEVIGGERDETGKKIIIDNEDNLVILGATNSQNILGLSTSGSLDLLLVKMTKGGQILSTNTYGGTQYEEPATVLQKANGNYLVTGTTYSEDGLLSTNAGQADLWVFEIDPSGVIVWSETHGGNDDEFAVDMKVQDDGSLIILANTSTYEGDYEKNHGDIDIVLYHTSSFGQLLWKDLYGGILADYAADIELLSNGHFLVAGNTFSSNGSVPNNSGGSDALLMEIDQTGDLLWSKTYGSSGNERIADLERKGEGYILFGSTNSDFVSGSVGFGSQDFWIYELNGNMEPVNEYLFGASGFDEGVTFSLQSDGSVLMGGESNSTDGVIAANLGKNDGWLIKVDGNFDSDAAKASVHPNPTSGTVYVNDLDENAELSLTDMKGSPVSSTITPYGTSRVLDLQAHPAGIYILKVTYPDREEIHRIQVK